MSAMARRTRYFYQSGALFTLKEGDLNRTIFRYSGAALAEHERCTYLLASDSDGSALIAHDGMSAVHQSFSPYGHSPCTISAIAYNGEVEDRYSKLYFLGIGNHRAYSSKLQRFLGSDEKSPIGEGGINSYGYCGADPVNFRDPSGAMKIPKLPLTPIKKPRPPAQIERIVREFNAWAAKPEGKKALASTTGDPRAKKLTSMYTETFSGQLKKSHKTSTGSRNRLTGELDSYIQQEQQYNDKQLQKLMSAQTTDDLTSTSKKALSREELAERYYEKKRSSSDRLTLAEYIRDMIRI
ncbi:RHS repeat-associated core domain-containing protein [Pseudomonas sp. SWRI51]|uniref:RHS repeat-associated core domain-containing protein n=1 Tax=Pseudomonas sp. SWRI51 TaxID=2745491 RepID=UPI001645429F|nr:RHS repeat-associated core domain-containing protein [Pseudomonas sp. SWRI51]MBC3409932.1 RHS repeat-associated core domain-containing protein [Pseudomonas sp. SWRI51]